MYSTFIEWTFLLASVRRLRHFYSSKRKEKKEKDKEEKGLLGDIFVWCFPVGLTFCYIFKKKVKRKNNCFLNIVIICLVVAY